MGLMSSLTSLAAIASVAGGMWFGLQLPEPAEGASAGDPAKVAGVYLELDLIAVSLIQDDQVRGYLLGRFYIQTNEHSIARFGDKFDVYLADAINTALITDTRLVERENSYDIYKDVIGDLVVSVNKKLGGNVVENIFASQLDVLDKNAVRMPRNENVLN